MLMKRLAAGFCALAITLAPYATVFAQSADPAPNKPSKIDMNLSSTDRNLTAGRLLKDNTVNITIDGQSREVSRATPLTAAERLAVFQMVSKGEQTILLGTEGNAVGGTLNIGANFSKHVQSLTVPSAVTVLADFAHGHLNLVGDLVNAGSIYTVSSLGHVKTADINADNIINQGLISNILPGGGVSGFSGANPIADINLTALHDIINSGTIASRGNLSLSAGGSITNQAQGAITAQNLNLYSASQIVNQGSITSQLGNIVATANVLTNAGLIQSMNGSMTIQSLTHTLDVNNSGGTLAAKHELLFETLGKLQANDNANAVLANLHVNAGILAGEQIRFNSPSGLVAVNVDELNGPVHVSGGLASVGSKSDLTIASLNLTGDPIFQSGGDLDLSGIFTAGVFATNGGDFIALAGRDIIAPTLVGEATIDATTTSGNRGGRIVIAAGVIFAVVGNTNCHDCTGIWATDGASLSGGNVDIPDISLKTNSWLVDVVANEGIGSQPGKRDGTIAIGNIETAGAGGAPVGILNNAGQPGKDGGNILILASSTVTTGYLRSYGGGGSGGGGHANGGAGGRGGNITVINNNGDIVIHGDVNSSGGGGGGGAHSGFAGQPPVNGGPGGGAGDISILVGAFDPSSTGNLLIEGPVLAAGGGGGSIRGGGGSFGGGGGMGVTGGSATNRTGGGGGIFGGGEAGRAFAPLPVSNGGGGGGLWGGGGRDFAGGFGYGADSPGNDTLIKAPFGTGGEGGSPGSGDEGGDVAQAGPAGSAAGNGGVINLATSGSTSSITVEKTVGTYYGFTDSPYKDVAVSAAGQSGAVNVFLPDGGSSRTAAYLPDANYGSGATAYLADLVGNGFTTTGTTVGSTIEIGPNTYTSPLAAGTYYGNIAVPIFENGITVTVTPTSMLTPAEWVAVVQSTRGGQTINLTAPSGLGSGHATSGIIGVEAQNAPVSGFTNLVLPANVTLRGNTSLIYSGSAVINGDVDLTGNPAPLATFTAASVAGTGRITANKLALTATNGDIGSAATPLQTTINELHMSNLTGSSFISNSKNLHIGSLVLEESAAISVLGHLTAGNLSFTSAPQLEFDVLGNVTLGNVTVAGAGGLPYDSLIRLQPENGKDGGSLDISAFGNITTGSIQAYGGGGGGGVLSTAGNGGRGGTVRLETPGIVTVNGAINVSGGGGGGQGEMGGGGNGGAGGTVFISGTAMVAIDGPVLAAGGGGGGTFQALSGVGGGGGSFGGGGGAGASLLGPGGIEAGGGGGVIAPGTGGSPFQASARGGGGGGGISGGGAGGGGSGGNGAFGVGGTWPLHGTGGAFGKGGSGDGVGGTAGGDVGMDGVGLGAGIAGAGGDVDIQSTGSISISKTVFSGLGIASPFYGAVAVGALGPGGDVHILTQSPGTPANSVYFVDANYGMGANAYAAPIIGTNPGATIAGFTTAPSISIQGQQYSGSVANGSFAGRNFINILENGNSVRIYNDDLITPSEWIAVLQTASGVQSLILHTPTPGIPGGGFAGGGTFTIAAANLPAGGFSALLLPVSVTQVVDIAALTYNGDAIIDGSIQFNPGTCSLTAESMTGSGSISGTNLTLTATFGSIGSQASPLLAQSALLTLTASAGSVFLETESSFGDPLIIRNSSVLSTFKLNDLSGEGYESEAGKSISAQHLILTSTGNIGGTNVPIVTNATKVTVFSDDSSVNVVDTKNGVIELIFAFGIQNSAGDSYSLSAPNGSILAAQDPVHAENTLTLVAGGDIVADDLSANHVVLKGASIGAANDFTRVVASELTVQATLGSLYVTNQAGGTLELVDTATVSNSAAVDYSLRSDNANVLISDEVSAGNKISINSASSTISGTDVLDAPRLELSGTEIGAAGSPLDVSVNFLTARATSGGVYLRSIGNTSLVTTGFANQAATDYQLENLSGNISVGGSVSAATIFLSAPNNRSISSTSSDALSATHVLLKAGSIGSVNSPVLTNTSNLTADSVNGSYISNLLSAPLSLSSSTNPALQNHSGGDYFVTQPGHLIVADNVTAQRIYLLVADSISGSGTLEAGTVLLEAEDIGTDVNPLHTITAQLTASASGDVYISDARAGGVSLSNAPAFGLTNNASGIFMLANSGGGVAIGNNVQAASIFLTADVGTITGTGVLSASHVELIGNSIGSGAQHVNTAAATLTLNADVGGVFVSNSYGAGTSLIDGSVANQAATIFHVDQLSGDLDFQSNVIAGQQAVLTASSSNTVNGGSLIGPITLSAPEVVVAAGSIGTSSAPLITSTSQLTADAASGDVFIINLKPVAGPEDLVLSNSSNPANFNQAPGVYFVDQRGGGIEVDSPVLAQTIVLKAEFGISGSGSLSAPAVVLRAASIGTASNPLSTAASQLSLRATDGSVIVSNQSTQVELLDSALYGVSNGATQIYSLNQSGDILIAGDVNAVTIELNAGGNIDRSGSSTLTAPELLLFAQQIGSATTPILTKTGNMSVETTDGSAYLENRASGLSVQLSSTSTADLRVVEINGSIEVDGIVAQGTVHLSAAVDLSTSGSASVKGQTVVLDAGGLQGIGLPSAFLRTETINLTANAANGSVYIADVGSGPVTLKSQSALGLTNSAAGDFYVRAIGSVTVDGPVATEGTATLETGTSGSVTVNQNQSVTGSNVTVITPTLNHNGSIVADGTGANGNVSVTSNAGNKALTVALGSGSSISANGLVTFNSSGSPGAITMNSQNGSIDAGGGAGFVYLYGGSNAVAVDVASINGIISGNGAPLSVVTHSGNLVTSVLSSMDNITLKALGGNVTIGGTLDADGAVALESASTGSVTVNQNQSVTGSNVNVVTPTLNHNGSIVAVGSGADGNVSVTSNAGNKALTVALGSGSSITANGFVAFNSDASRGAVTMNSQNGSIAAGAGAGFVYFYGGDNAVAVDVASISGIISGNGAPLSVVTHSGNLVASVLNSTDNITLKALGGNVTIGGTLDAQGAVSLESVSTGSVTVNQNQSVTGSNVTVVTPTLNHNGSIVADGSGANGNVSVTSNAGNKALTVALGSGSSITANGFVAFNSDTSRGAITMNSQNGSIAAAAGSGNVFLHGGDNAVAVDVHSINGIVTGSGAPLSVVTHSGNLVSSVLDSTSDITLNALAGDLVVGGNVTAQATVSLIMPSSVGPAGAAIPNPHQILQTGGTVTAKHLQMAAGLGGILSDAVDGAFVAAVNDGDLSVSTTGSSSISNTGVLTLLDSSAGRSFSLINSDSLLMNDLSTANGQIFVQAAKGTLSVADLSVVQAAGGTLTFHNSDDSAGRIVIGKDVAILDSYSPGAAIRIVLGVLRTPTNTFRPDNVVVRTPSGGSVFFGPNSIEASEPVSMVSARGSNAQVVFDTGGAPASAISLGGGDLIVASNSSSLDSLDLTDPTVVAAIVAQQKAGLLAGQLQVNSDNIAVGGWLSLTPADITRTISAFNVPVGVNILFDNFLSSMPVEVQLDATSHTDKVVIDGNVRFTGRLDAASVMTVSSDQTHLGQIAVALGTTGKLRTTTSDLILNSNGSLSILGTVTGPVTLLTSNASNGDIIIGETGSIIARSGPSQFIAAGNITNAGALVGGDTMLISAAGTISTTENSTIRISSGPVSITAAGLTLSGRLLADSVTLNTNTLTQAISVGGSTAGAFNVFPESLQQISADTIIIGSQTQTGGIVIAGSFAAPSRHLMLSTGGNISGTGQVSGALLTLAAGGDIGSKSQHLNVDVDTLTATAAGNVHVLAAQLVNLSGASAAAGTDGLNLTAGGSIRILSGATVAGAHSASLTANGPKGSISQDSKGATIFSPVINLTAGTGFKSSIGTGSRSMVVNSGATGIAAAVNAVSGGSVYVAGNSSAGVSGDLTLSGSSSAGTRFAVVASGNITIAGSVTANDSISLTANGAGTSILQSASAAGLFGPVINLTADTSAGGSGGIGGALSPVVVNPFPGSTVLPKLTAGSSGAVHVHAGQGMVVANVSTNSDINSDAGSIVLTSVTGLLQVSSSGLVKANGGSITIQNLDASGAGSIQIGKGTSFHASSTVADIGHVNVVIGQLPGSPQSGQVPAKVQKVETNGGLVFFGASGITAVGPTNKLLAEGRNIVFETNGQPASAIQLGGGVKIIADPPAAGAAISGLTAPTVGLSATTHPAAAANGAGAAGIVSAVGMDSRMPTGANALAPTSNLTSAASNSTVNTAVSTQATGLTTAFQTGAAVGFDPEDIVVFDGSSVRAEAEIAPNNASSLERQPSDLVPISLIASGPVPNPVKVAMAVPACALTGDRLLHTISEHDAVRQLRARGVDADITAQAGNIILRHGSVLFAPDRKMVVHTTAGPIMLGPGSVVLVAATAGCVAVYDLHDRHMNDAVITAGAKQIVMTPGQHVLLTHQGVQALEEINPLRCIGHRKVIMKVLESGIRQFSSDFSIVSALQGLKPLVQMTRSANPRDARAIEQIMKTAAIVAQMNGGQDAYRQMSPTRRSSRSF